MRITLVNQSIRVVKVIPCYIDSALKQKWFAFAAMQRNPCRFYMIESPRVTHVSREPWAFFV